MFSKLFIYRNKKIKPYVDYLLQGISFITYIMAVMMLITVIFEYGFILKSEHEVAISRIYHRVWQVFLVNTIAYIVLDFKNEIKRYKKITWVVNTMLLLTLLPVIFNNPSELPYIYNVIHIFDNYTYTTLLLVVMSLLKLSNGLVRLLGKRSDPSLICAVSFLAFVLIGAGLLMMPRSTVNGISFTDSLFTSTSAVCVTGLTTVDISTTFTQMGKVIIIALIQVGGLGIMTLTSFFAVFFMGNTSVNNQELMCDIVSSKSLNSLFSTLMYILGFTLIIELIGAAIILYGVHGAMGMTLQQEIKFAIFHSISAFCNAGFSTLPNNLGDIQFIAGHNIMFLAISFLVIFGGIGFPILVNLYQTVKYNIKISIARIFSRGVRIRKRVHLYNLNTQIVLITSAILIVVGTASIAALEWNNAFEHLSLTDKLVQSFFTAVSPRTAGFTSFSLSSYQIQSVLIIMALMVIGGGAQSTAGGIKVNVFAVVLLNLRSIVCGRDSVTTFNRELSRNSILRSNSTVIIYLIFIFMAIYILTLLEPQASLLAITFECISALSTVGASLDLTPTLGDDSKIVIISLMFLGRVGVLTVMASLIRQRKGVKYRYASDDIIIN